MNGLQKWYTCLAQFVDGIQFEDGVVDDDTTGYHDTDGTHQVERVATEPQDPQGGSHSDRNLHQDDQRLQETLELGG